MNTLEPAAQSKPPGGFKLWLSQLQMKHGRKLVIALPYIWLILLFLLPFLIVFKISLAEMARAIPPYTELMEWADGQLSITLNLGNFLQLTDDPLYFDAYLQSLQVAAISTFCCLLIGYPLAWAVAHSKPSTRNILLLLVILPSWTSFLIRVYAWMGILKNNGVLNNFLLWLGVIDQPLTILHTNLAVYIGNQRPCNVNSRCGRNCRIYRLVSDGSRRKTADTRYPACKTWLKTLKFANLAT